MKIVKFVSSQLGIGKLFGFIPIIQHTFVDTGTRKGIITKYGQKLRMNTLRITDGDAIRNHLTNIPDIGYTFADSPQNNKRWDAKLRLRIPRHARKELSDDHR